LTNQEARSVIGSRGRRPVPFTHWPPDASIRGRQLRILCHRRQLASRLRATCGNQKVVCDPDAHAYLPK